MIPRRLCTSRLRPAAGNNVLLTFDDGPHPDVTSAVLDRLRAYQARAVFFVVGNRIPRAPEMLSRIVSEGHWLGNHTYKHPNDRRMRYREYCDDLRQCQEAIFQHAGIYPKLHRPPWGQMTIASLWAPKSVNLSTMHWSYSAELWRAGSGTEAASRVEEMSDEIAARDIILFHDEKIHTAAALDQLLPALKSRGLEFSPDFEHFG